MALQPPGAAPPRCPPGPPAELALGRPPGAAARRGAPAGPPPPGPRRGVAARRPGPRAAAAGAGAALVLVAGARRLGARRRAAARAAGHAKPPDIADLQASLESVSARLRDIDALQSSVCFGRFPAKSAAGGLRALKRLEELAGPLDSDSLAEALARAISPESPESPSARAAARAAAPALAPDAPEARLAAEALADAEALAGGEGPALTEAERRLAEELRARAEALGAADARGAPRRWPPPPPRADPRREAQDARLPAVAALEAAAREAPAAAAAPPPAPARAASLAEVLAAAGQAPLAAAGDAARCRVSGVADAASLLRAGDLAVLALRPGPGRDAAARAALAAAGAAGAAAAVLLGAEAGDAAHVEAWLEAGAGLEALALLPDAAAAPRLARAFWGDPARGLECLLVRGDEPLEVRTAAWLLARLAEARPGAGAGAGGAALLSGRAAALTPCLVQELLAGAVAAGAELCVAEALPGAHSADAFEGLTFALELDCREQLLRQPTAAARGVARAFQLEPLARLPWGAKQKIAKGIKEAADRCGFPLEGTADENERLSELTARGLGLQPAASYAPLGPAPGPEEAAAAPAPAPAPAPGERPEGVLAGEVLPGTSTGRLRLALGLEDFGEARVALPLLGMPGARAALGAACAAAALWGSAAGEPGGMPWLSAALESVPAPPGTLEVLTAGAAHEVVAVLHEAQTPDEVRGALRAVREWLLLGHEDFSPRLTAVVGCPGELARGDRAKLGWALAELCDRVVLTAEQPRAEPPLQVLEDILEAVRARAPRKADFQPLPPATDVHVVVDRVDAIKLGACLSTPPDKDLVRGAATAGVVVVLGSGSGVQEAAGPDGEVRAWLCDDRQVLLEAVEAAERLRGLADVSRVPWGVQGAPAEGPGRVALELPGQSLHWTHRAAVRTRGSVELPL